MAPAPTVNDLIIAVRADAPSPDPLDELLMAAQLVADLNQTSDSALDFFVDQCRRSGRSWTEISTALGVSKQAAHKRFMPAAPASDRYTKRAQSALRAASEEASRLGHNFLGTEHLLLGLFEPAGGIAARILGESDVTRDAVERKILERVPTVWTQTGAHGSDPAQTPRATRCLDRALAEAVAMGHNYIGTEHLLLALFDDQEGLAAKILADLGVEVTTVRRRVTDMLASPRRSS